MNTPIDLLFSFQGRISRAPWWGWKVVFTILNIALWALAGATHSYFALAFVIPLIGLVIWACTALDVKRFHDRGKSGWWMLVGGIPILGSLWLLIDLGFCPGTDGENRYGYRNRYG